MKRLLLCLLMITALLWSRRALPMERGKQFFEGLLTQSNTDKRLRIEEAKEGVMGTKQDLIYLHGMTIRERILVPEGYERIPVSANSFQAYLTSLPLKKHGAQVLHYDGTPKTKTNVYEAVVDMDIGNRDLQQCADAIMRLRAEYLYGLGEYEKIYFHFTNGFRADYGKWIQGHRIVVDGNRANWVRKTTPSTEYEGFRKYLDIVFAYAGTLSLAKELKPVEVAKMDIGDVFIQGGSPGHAVIVVDMAENKETREKLFLLAQSYMPAQDIQVLINPNNDVLSPWYKLQENEKLYTPEWSFEWDDLKAFVK